MESSPSDGTILPGIGSGLLFDRGPKLCSIDTFDPNRMGNRPAGVRQTTESKVVPGPTRHHVIERLGGDNLPTREFTLPQVSRSGQ